MVYTTTIVKVADLLPGDRSLLFDAVVDHVDIITVDGNDLLKVTWTDGQESYYFTYARITIHAREA
jgi:hypothetical protein